MTRSRYKFFENEYPYFMTCTVNSWLWKPVWRIVQKAALPKSPPRLNELMKRITQRGGDNNRAQGLPRRTQPVWISLRRMLDFSIVWLTFGEPDGSCVSKTALLGARGSRSVFGRSGKTARDGGCHV